ncbi:hypothetical protein AB0K18_17395 [Nonomuraea sp. NPDC049421]|uniref:hypothetical protein n=1 Tax=Nonomuraea sp. NPDC049421 TaxID=3155275 RepID=UPI00343DC3D7
MPAHVLEGVPVRPYQREDVVEWAGRRCAGWRSRGARADLAVKKGLRWLEGWDPGQEGVTPVFGAGDGSAGGCTR